MPLQTKQTIKGSPLTLEPFRWLFIAHFEDGSEIVQEADDKSKTRTDGTGSSFTDVLEIAKRKKLMAFTLRSVAGNAGHVTVDLVSGNFVVNGVPVCAHNQNFEPHRYPLELVYFRETRAEQTQTVKGDIVSARHYVNRYFIGWKTTVNGKDKQVTLAVG